MSNKVIKSLYQSNKRWYNCPECKAVNKLGIDLKGEYLVYHCFKCEYSGKTKFISSRINAAPIQVGEYQTTPLRLPAMKFNPLAWTLNVRGYLFQYGITDSELMKYKVGSYDNTLVYSVIDRGKLLFYHQKDIISKQARSVGVKRGWYLDNTESSTLVIVEDPISAMKVARHHKAICLFGTSFTHEVLLQVVSIDCDKIVIWLDNDNWRVVRARNKIKKKLNSVLTIPVECVTDREDPKHYSSEDIKNSL